MIPSWAGPGTIARAIQLFYLIPIGHMNWYEWHVNLYTCHFYMDWYPKAPLTAFQACHKLFLLKTDPGEGRALFLVFFLGSCFVTFAFFVRFGFLSNFTIFAGSEKVTFWGGSVVIWRRLAQHGLWAKT